MKTFYEYIRAEYGMKNLEVALMNGVIDFFEEAKKMYERDKGFEDNDGLMKTVSISDYADDFIDCLTCDISDLIQGYVEDVLKQDFINMSDEDYYSYYYELIDLFSEDLDEAFADSVHEYNEECNEELLTRSNNYAYYAYLADCNYSEYGC